MENSIFDIFLSFLLLVERSQMFDRLQVLFHHVEEVIEQWRNENKTGRKGAIPSLEQVVRGTACDAEG
jgi:hypothetical protein